MIVSRERVRLSNSTETAQHLIKILSRADPLDREREQFWAILLNTRNVVISVEMVAIGTVNACFIHPREVFRRAILNNACAVILGHNHPSGDMKPSEEDMSLTRRVCEAGKVVGIRVLDHVIVSDEGSFSFLDSGMMS
jgi:DNA repair protein RadC